MANTGTEHHFVQRNTKYSVIHRKKSMYIWCALCYSDNDPKFKCRQNKIKKHIGFLILIKYKLEPVYFHVAYIKLILAIIDLTG